MKVILNKDLKNLGEEGDTCSVKDGYARNFLLPQGLAVPYNRLNANNFRAKTQAIAQRKEHKRRQALDFKQRLEGELTLEIVMPSAGSGRLFGAVTNATIAEQLAHQGINIERRRLDVPGRAIKAVGNYVVKARLYNDQIASLKVCVRSPEQKEKQGAEGTEGTEGTKEEAELESAVESKLATESAAELESAVESKLAESAPDNPVDASVAESAQSH